MINKAGLITVSLMLLLACIYLNGARLALEEEMTQGTEKCEQDLALLRSRYAELSADILRHTAIQTPTEDKVGASEQALPSVNLETLVSHNHKVQAVVQKYEFLLASAQVDKSDKALLRKLLTRREILVNRIAFADSDINLNEVNKQLSEAEEHIAVILNDSLDYQRYEFLRERNL